MISRVKGKLLPNVLRTVSAIIINGWWDERTLPTWAQFWEARLCLSQARTKWGMIEEQHLFKKPWSSWPQLVEPCKGPLPG